MNLCNNICGLCVCELEHQHRGMHACFCGAEWVHGPAIYPRAEQLRRVPADVHFEKMMWTPPAPITPEIRAVLDAAVAHNEAFVGSPVLADPIVANLVYAVDAYRASIRPLAASVELERGGLLRLTLADGSTVDYDVSDPHHPTIKEWI